MAQNKNISMPCGKSRMRSWALLSPARPALRHPPSDLFALGVEAFDLDAIGPAAIQRALRRERSLAGRPGYDLARHAALVAAMKRLDGRKRNARKTAMAR